MDDNTDQSGSPEVDIGNQAEQSSSAEADFLANGSEQLDNEGGEPLVVDDQQEDVEYEGKQYRLPKELKDAILRQSDYTRKTQEVAEQRRAHEEQTARFHQEQQQFAQRVQMQQANIQAYANVAALDQQLQQYQQVNWQQLNAENPVEAQRLFIQQQQLKDQRGQLANQISQYERHTALQQQQEIAQRLEQGKQAIAREIKDWTPETQKALVDFGKKAGYSDAELSNIQDHRAVLVLHKAMRYDQMMQKASQKPPVASAPAAPVRTVGSGGSGSAKSPDQMNMNEWAEWDRKRQAKRRS